MNTKQTSRYDQYPWMDFDELILATMRDVDDFPDARHVAQHWCLQELNCVANMLPRSHGHIWALEELRYEMGGYPPHMRT